ncbi:MAG: NAC domain-containing protein [Cenarchaeum symbiont of Oopsacas minuta]|nr:NAC domain-containing protein [Cenarchaeum symbiont of Oopsacas minuta]
MEHSVMMRGGNRNMRRMMDKMGLDMQEMSNVHEVLIRTDKKEIILSKPEVTEMKAKDKSIFTITADSYEEKELDVPIFSDEDIDLVCLQANVDKEKAIDALTKSDGDIARAILLLTTG